MVKTIPKNSHTASNPFAQLIQSSGLPGLKRAEPIPALFDDSTHQLWFCETDDGNMILKVCHQHNVDNSAIWQVMQQLFDVYLPNDLAKFRQIQQRIAQHARFELPELIACAGMQAQAPAFILSRFLAGDALSMLQVNDVMVVQLAEHVAALHSQRQTTWGPVHQADKKAEQWPEALLKTIVCHCQRHGIREPWLSLAISQIEQINPIKFAPIMVDNRWDQFLTQNGKISALVDLDAFVIGPIELELVLLEYQLSDKQAQLFADAYQRYLTLPDLSNQRLIYRLLLFVMNALGETDLDKWMQAPAKW